MAKKEANSKTKILKKVLIALIVLIFLVVIFYFITSIITKYTGFFVIDYNKNFQSCLKEKTIIVYINSNAPEKTLENFEAKDYLENINIFNCLRDKEYCNNQNINYFPTWFIDDRKIEGDISLEVLAKASGCLLDRKN